MNLRDEAKGRECQIRLISVCNRNDDTTVLAHLRLSGITGGSQKAPDILGAWACSDCHTFTERNKEDDQVQRAFYDGMARTQYQLIKEGKISW